MRTREHLSDMRTRVLATAMALTMGAAATVGLAAGRSVVSEVASQQAVRTLTPDAPGMVHDVTDRDGACEPRWVAGEFCLPGLNGYAHAAVTWDDGTGEALYVGGFFSVAGCATVTNVARWDGSAWTPLGSGPNSTVFALTVFDDGGGAGPALYAGGLFTAAGGQTVNRIARWDGSAWNPVGSGMNGNVSALTVFDDGGGAGPALYAGGGFTTAGGQPASRIARWNGSEWSPVGSGMNSAVLALTVFDDGGGAGPALYAGGGFTTAGGQLASRIARWNGSAWSPLGTGVNHNFAPVVHALTVRDDGSGPSLIVGGWFSVAGGQSARNIARWNGTAWSPLGSGFNTTVLSLAVFDDGAPAGPTLYAGLADSSEGERGTGNIARWDGSAWLDVGWGLNESVHVLTTFDEGAGPALFAGGAFTGAGELWAPFIARWSGTAWSPLGSGLIGEVLALTGSYDGDAPALYAGGRFTIAGGQAVSNIARWDGAAWSPLGSGVSGGVHALTVFDDGSGPALYAGGSFGAAGGQGVSNIARWDGSAWSPLGSGVNGGVHALTVFDDGSGPALYAGGNFSTAGGQPASRIARWDGSGWSPLGAGITGQVGTGTTVLALTVHDDGTGPALYAGGSFTTAGGQPANSIARWDGAAWSPLGSGVSGMVQALTVYDDAGGAGPALYAGGWFGPGGNHIARWDGSVWSPVGSGMNGGVGALAVFDDGRGPALYAVGSFTTAGGQPASRIARWNGSAWSPLGSGLSTISGVGLFTFVYALAVTDLHDGAGPALFAGGEFTTAGGQASTNLARWQSCPTGSACPPDLNADALLNFFDIAAFLNLYQTQDPIADWNDDGLFNFFDLASYLNAFNAGCP